jgi:hypothetical protein
MKRIIKILAISILLLQGILFSQTNIQQIYFTDSIYINNFTYTTNIFINKKNFYIQIFKDSPSFINYEPRHGRWYRYLYDLHSFECSMHNYMFSNGYMQCNPWPWYAYTYAEQFVFSKSDTNFILFSITGANCFEPFEYVRLTYNNGINYTQTPFYNESLGSMLKGFDIDPLNDSVIYIGYDMGYYPNNFFKSTNRGANWIFTDTVPDINMTLTKVIKVNPLSRNIIYIGLNKGLARSTNSGYMFTRVNIDSVVVNSFHFDMTDSSIYVTSYSLWSNYTPGIFKSSDLGANWVRIFNSPCRALEIDPSQHNILYAGDSIIYRSTNGGLNWSTYHNGIFPSKRIIGICKNPGNDTFFVATTKGVYKIWGPYVGINIENNKFPEQFYLSQNYPNPFNPVTKIKFDVPLDSRLRGNDNVTLKIFDVLGREITTLVSEKLSPGTYEVEWDGSNYPSGVYFYKLVTADYSETRKMVLVK